MRGEMADPRMSRHVTDEWPELRDLFATGEEIESLLGSPGWAALSALLDAEVARIDSELDGQARNLGHSELTYLLGRRGGIRAVDEAAEAVLDRYRRQLADQQAKHEGDGESSLERNGHGSLRTGPSG